MKRTLFIEKKNFDRNYKNICIKMLNLNSHQENANYKYEILSVQFSLSHVPLIETT